MSQQLELGITVDARDPDNDRTPLMEAVTSGVATVEMVRLLLEHGADVNAVENQENRSVLSLAVQHGTIAKVEVLLEAGADIQYHRDGGYDVLIDAMHSQAMVEKDPLLPLMELLLAHGAPTEGESDYSESALSVSSHMGRFDIVKRLLEAGADTQLLEWSELMHAVAWGSLQEVERLVGEGANLATRDRWQRTPWLLSLQTGDVQKAQLLLSAGASLNEAGNCGQTALMHAIENERVEVLSWLLAQGADVDGRDDFGHTALMMAAQQGATECVQRLLEAGADASLTDGTDTRGQDTKAILEEFDPALKDMDLPDFDELSGETALAKAANLDIVRLLVAAGEELGDISDEMRVQLTSLESEGEIHCSRAAYRKGKHRRFGTANPQRMDVEFWEAMVRSGATAYRARVTFDDTDDMRDEPVWCFHRFGKSITLLPDGRIIEIGGEHEDYYDSDFCIYNEVFVHQGGGRFDIFSYPEAVFPPTDFHSATLIGNAIYIIGCLGYPEARLSGETPLYRLDCETLTMEKVITTGDKPGWISRHRAIYHVGDAPSAEIRVWGGNICEIANGQEEYFENPHTYVLNLASMSWSRVET